MRIDKESREPVHPVIEAELCAYVESVLPAVEGVVISDYGAGTVTEKLQDLLIRHCREHDIPSIVDSRYAIHRFRGIGYVKQNDAELAAAVGRELATTEDIIRAAEELRRELQAKGVLVTRGELGMVLVESGAVHEIPVSDKSEVFDVSGAVTPVSRPSSWRLPPAQSRRSPRASATSRAASPCASSARARSPCASSPRPSRIKIQNTRQSEGIPC